KAAGWDEPLIGKLNFYLFHDDCLHSFLMEYCIRKHHQMGDIVNIFKSIDRPHKQSDCSMK
ncbi:hypothetical protein, partial [Enterocloster clostridioformis]|uniref:hypothetical protein n=1 Tax=Enterocloster clostridioformis TaxID=1531 RepID=UPI00321B2D34